MFALIGSTGLRFEFLSNLLQQVIQPLARLRAWGYPSMCLIHGVLFCMFRQVRAASAPSLWSRTSCD